MQELRRGLLHEVCWGLLCHGGGEEHFGELVGHYPALPDVEQQWKGRGDPGKGADRVRGPCRRKGDSPGQ